VSLSVRPARLGDVPALTLLLNRIIQIGGTTALEEPLSEAQFAEYFLNGDEALFCHLVESDGQPVGSNPSAGMARPTAGAISRPSPAPNPKSPASAPPSSPTRSRRPGNTG